MSLLEINNLTTSFETEQGKVQAVRGISLAVEQGEIVGIVGESGSGKSQSMYSVMGLLSENGTVEDGSILFDGQEISPTRFTGGAHAYEKMMEGIRGRTLSMIFQDPMSFLNPVLTIEKQLVEPMKNHLHLSGEELHQRAVQLLTQVGIPSPEERLKQYPHQLSGGMRQRVIIALATFMGPRLVLADEPTTALDVVVQRGILMMLTHLQKQLKNTMVIVSHDMGVHYQITDRMAIMYSGSVVELGKTEDIFNDPVHPYTTMLVNALPRVGDRSQRVGIPGRPPALASPPPGCRFAPRCPHATDRCRSEVPVFREVKPGRFAACHLLNEEVQKNG